MFTDVYKEGTLCAWRVQVSGSSGSRSSVIAVDNRTHRITCDGKVIAASSLDQEVKCQIVSIYHFIFPLLGGTEEETKRAMSIVIRQGESKTFPRSATLSLDTLDPQVTITPLGNEVRKRLGQFNSSCSPWQARVRSDNPSTLEEADVKKLQALVNKNGQETAASQGYSWEVKFVLALLSVAYLPLLLTLPYRPLSWSVVACIFLSTPLVCSIILILFTPCCNVRCMRTKLRNCCRRNLHGAYAHLPEHANQVDEVTEHIARSYKCSESFLQHCPSIMLALGGLAILGYSTMVQLQHLSSTPLGSPLSSAIDPRYNVYRFDPDIQVRPDLYTTLETQEKVSSMTTLSRRRWCPHRIG